MKEAPEAVYLIIPLMKELGMRWDDIKKSPRDELEGLLSAFGIYRQMHQFDGYTSEDISKQAKENPKIRSDYLKYLETNEKYRERLGIKKKVTSFKELIE
jgi:hypothetical protein